MQLTWKEFKINLKKFYEYLQQNVPEADGIAAYPDKFIVVEKIAFTLEKQTLIQDYYNSLTQETESA